MFRKFQIGLIVALLIALGNCPYDYYTLLRVSVCAVSLYGVSIARSKQDLRWTWAFSIVALVYNPILPIHLQRATWQMLNLGTIVFFIVSLRTFAPGTKR